MPYASRYSDYLHVVAAAIIDGCGNVLIARRPPHLHQGDLWEFPGGKVEQGESSRTALSRELEEELGIHVVSARPLVRVPYRYPDRAVFLDVWLVDGFTGQPHGREGQPIRWVSQEYLSGYSFPAANSRIITALSLPDRYLITPEPGARENWPYFLERLDDCLRAGIKLVQLRAKRMVDEELGLLTQQAKTLCHQHGARLLINATPEQAVAYGVDGVHVTSIALHAHQSRPLSSEMLVAASCHTLDDIVHAGDIGADLVVLSPVKPTASHPGAVTLGWDGFERICAVSLAPVYALGGMGISDIAATQARGGHGIAAVSSLWDGCADSVID